MLSDPLAWAIEADGQCIGHCRLHSPDKDNRSARYAIGIFNRETSADRETRLSDLRTTLIEVKGTLTAALAPPKVTLDGRKPEETGSRKQTASRREDGLP